MKKITFLLLLMLVAVSASALPFVTTSSPTTYPIHWYQLKINGKYLYSYSGQWMDVDASSSASTADAYLWCFVTTSSGKTLVFNKAERQYMRSGYFFTTDMTHSAINYVEEGSGNTFYICFKAEGTTFYLDYDEDNGLHSPSWKMNTFTAIEALVQNEAPTPSGELELTLDEYDEYCMLSANYTGNEEHTVTLNVDGRNVNNPYRITRTYQDKNLDVIATVTFNDMDPVVVQQTVTVPAKPLTDLTGEVIFDVEENEKNCVISVYYVGPESYSLALYANGQQVNEPYTVARTAVDQHITMKAVITASGKNPLVVEEVVTIPKYVEPELDLTFTAYSVSSNVPNPTGGQGFMKLFDKNPNTKWLVLFDTEGWQTVFVEFSSDKPFVPTGYVMTTGDDAQNNPNRNPKAWKIYGRVDWMEDWEILADVTDGAAAGLGSGSVTDYNFDITGLKKEYRQFRFEVSEVNGVESSGLHVFQLAELRLRGKAASSEPSGDLNGDGNVNTGDVSALYTAVLSGSTDAMYDINGDGNVNTGDVSALYAIILGSN